jgi:rod shape-determining protein MreD
MRRTWLAPVLLAVALLLQLTVLNGLHLPGGGVPDLVLLLVVALAITDGPVAGMVTGFASGLCLDLAPPGSDVIGQYALVFCLAGWAAGRFAAGARWAPLRALAVAAAVIAAAEAVTAGLGLLLAPAQVTTAEIRQFLPITIGYDLLLWPFVLYLVVLASTVLASTVLARSVLASAGLAGNGLASNGPSGLAGARARSKRAERKRRPHEPRLGPGAARAGDGWVGGGPAGHIRARPSARRPARLHPGAGVAGSASGLVRQHPTSAAPVHLRLTGERRGDGAIGNVVGRGQARHWRPGPHPGSLAGPGRRFRPHGGEISGSAARQHAAAGLAATQTKINFSGRPGDASVGRRLGTSWLSKPVRRSGPGLRLRVGTGRSALSPATRTTRTAAVPKMRFRTTAPPVARRPAAVPKFRRGSRRRPSGMTTGLVAGGVLDSTTFRARRRSVAAPRLRLAGSRGGGMLGGSGRSPLRRPPARSRRQPRFGYGRRSLLSFLAGRRIGGRWLASKRVGSRSGVWLIGKGMGGTR